MRVLKTPLIVFILSVLLCACSCAHHPPTIDKIINSIESSRLLEKSIFEHIPPEWIPHIGYSFEGTNITLEELRSMSTKERTIFYKNLINEYEYMGANFDWDSVKYSFSISNYEIITEEKAVWDLIKNLCGTYSFPETSNIYLDSDVFCDCLSSHDNAFYLLYTNVIVNNQELLQVDEMLFYVYVSDHDYYIAPTFMNNVMHMLAVYQQQYAQ